jgi:hypothetical protein
MGGKKKESEKFATSVAKHLQLVFCVFCVLLLLLGCLVFSSLFGEKKTKHKKTKAQKHKSFYHQL